MHTKDDGWNIMLIKELIDEGSVPQQCYLSLENNEEKSVQFECK